MKRRQLTKLERREIYRKMRGHCAYCGCELNIREMQVDHVQPLSRGGSDTLDNILPACRSCNHRKGSETVDSFRESVERFPKVLARDSVTYRNAVRFGLVKPNPHSVTFYFEQLEAQSAREEKEEMN